MTWILLTLFGLLLSIDDVTSLNTCVTCHDAREVTSCTMSVCSQDEICHLEKVVLPTLEVIWNGGCRSKQFCSILSIMVPGRRRDTQFLSKHLDMKSPLSRTSSLTRSGTDDVVICSQCCDNENSQSGACNTKLCGNTNSQLVLPKCLSSDGHVTGSLLAEKTTCEDTQICYNEVLVISNAVRYQYGCQELHLCRKLAEINAADNNIIGKKNVGIKLCSACCSDNLCNSRDCFELRKNMSSLLAPASG